MPHFLVSVDRFVDTCWVTVSSFIASVLLCFLPALPATSEDQTTATVVALTQSSFRKDAQQTFRHPSAVSTTVFEPRKYSPVFTLIWSLSLSISYFMSSVLCKILSITFVQKDCINKFDFTDTGLTPKGKTIRYLFSTGCSLAAAKQMMHYPGYNIL